MEVHSVEAIVRALNDAQVQYLIVGGLAVNAHGFVRLTRDVDLVIGLEPENIVRGLRSLMSIGYQLSIPITPEEFADRNRRETWRRENLKLWSDQHRRTPVDVFVYEPFDFARELSVALFEPLLGQVVAPVVSRDTLLEMKRAAGRPQDRIDIDELARAQKMKQEGI